MGILGNIFDPDRGQREELLKLLNRQLGEENERATKSIGAAIARVESAKEWLVANAPVITEDYNRLLNAFFTADPSVVQRAFMDAGDRAGIVANIPVYLGDGISTVSFAAMAEQMFPERSGLSYSLKQAKTAMPESAFTGKDAPGYYSNATGEVSQIAIRNTDESALMALSKEDQMKMVENFSQSLNALKTQVPHVTARYEKAVENIMTTGLSAIGATAARTYALRQGFAQGSADAVLANLTALGADRKVMDVLALGTGDADHADYTSLALASFDEPADTMRVYNALVALGQPPQAEKFMAFALKQPDDATVAAAITDLMTVLQKGNSPAARTLATGKDEQGTPWAVHAAHRPDVLIALLGPLETPAQRAVFLMDTADAADDKKTAEKMRAFAAMTATPGGKFLVLSHVLMRMANIDYAVARTDGLEYSLDGRATRINMKPEAAAAAVRILAQNKNFAAMNSGAAVNMERVTEMRRAADEGGKAVLETRFGGNQKRWGLTPAAADEIMSKFDSRAGTIKAGTGLINAALVDGVNVSRTSSGGGRMTVYARGEFTVDFPMQDAPTIQRRLTNANRALIAVGPHTLNAQRVAFALSRSGNGLSVMMGGARAPTVDDSTGAETITKLLERGHVRIGGLATFNPARSDMMSLRSQDNRRSGIVRYAVDGGAYEFNVEEYRDGAKILAAALRSDKEQYKVRDDLVINTGRLEYARAQGPTLHFSLSAKELNTNDYSSAIYSDLQRYNGFTKVSDTCVLNPDLVNMIAINKSELVLTFNSNSYLRTQGTASDMRGVIDAVMKGRDLPEAPAASVDRDEDVKKAPPKRRSRGPQP